MIGDSSAIRRSAAPAEGDAARSSPSCSAATARPASADAESALSQLGCPLDLIVTDLSLSGRVEGWRIAEAALTHWPQVRAIVVSGHLPQVDLAPARAWLAANAGSSKQFSEPPPQDRITRSAWFLREHREGEVSADVWKRASVGSPSNCQACHTGAGQGDFSERNIRIPK
jgi:hypothetical protein